MKKFFLAFLLLSLSALIFTPHSHALTFPGDFQIDSIQGSSLYWSNFIPGTDNPDQLPFPGCADGVGIQIQNTQLPGFFYYNGGVGGDNCTSNGAINFLDFSTLPVGQYIIRLS